MTHQFSRVPTIDIPRSVFNRTHTHKTTIDGGKLYPFYADEVLPGDNHRVKATLFGRLSTPIVPVMDNIFLDTHYFFVPLRLVWENFQKFMGEQDNPGDSTDYLIPQLVDDAETGFALGSIEDYLGLPISDQATGLSVNALYRRCYGLIWNEWFRDENLQDSVTVSKGDGPDNLSSQDFDILRRGKRHDYFTSALPWPQKGPGVEIPIGGSAIVDTSNAKVWTEGGGGLRFRNANNGNTIPNGFRTNPQTGIPTLQTDVFGTYDPAGPGGDPQGPYYPWRPANLEIAAKNDAQPALTADLASELININNLRQAFQLQRLRERDARGGTRYTEIVKSHFRVTSPDGRLQRPEYLGGSTTRMEFSSVAQTSSTDPNNTPQGNLSAYATVAKQEDGFSSAFTEHGIIIGLVSARADLTYQNGINRMFSRKTKYDYYWPTLAHLGEQAVLNKEIYATGDPLNDEGVFGYQERWAEYRYYPSKITGKFRSIINDDLDHWHLSEDFGNTPPVLNSTFIEDNPPLQRVIAVQDEPHIILDTFIDVRSARPMPVYSVPGLIDHL